MAWVLSTRFPMLLKTCVIIFLLINPGDKFLYGLPKKAQIPYKQRKKLQGEKERTFPIIF